MPSVAPREVRQPRLAFGTMAEVGERVAALEARVHRLEQPMRDREAAALAHWEREAEWGRQVDAAVRGYRKSGSTSRFEAPSGVRCVG